MKNLKLMFALVLIAMSMNIKLMAQPISEVMIINQPTDLIGCYDEINRVIGVVAANTGSANELSFQWYKDGVALTKDIEVPSPVNEAGIGFGNLRFHHSGVYTCAIWVPGDGDMFAPLTEGPNTPHVQAHFTKPVTVYVLNKPNITRQPRTVNAGQGETVFMNVEGTLFGELPPSYRTKVQWYAGNTALADGGDFSGTKQSHITVRNAEKYYNADIWCQLEGYCGTVNSATVTILEKPGVDITEDVTGNLEVCAGDENTLSITAEATNGGDDANLMYQWYVGSTALVDGATVSGSKTNQLTWTVAAGTTAGIHCIVTYGNDGESKSSAMVDVVGNEAPEFTAQPTGQEAKAGEEVTLEAMSNDDNASYTWYKEGSDDSVGEGQTLTLSDLAVEDSGEYYCVASNDCGETESDKVTVTVTEDSIELSVRTSDKFNFKLSPNPFQGTGNVEFNLPTAQNVRLSLNSATGYEVAVITEGNLPQGNQSFEISASNFNLSNGVYYLTLVTESGIATVKLVYVK
jgi:hypothetical protein